MITRFLLAIVALLLPVFTWAAEADVGIQTPQTEVAAVISGGSIPYFSWLTITMLLLGWLAHWLLSVRKAKAAAIAAKTSLPNLWSYWKADIEATVLSIIGLVVFYFALPQLATNFPTLAEFVGTTKDNPMNPLASFIGGIAAPFLCDWAGKRVAKMVGD